MFCISIGSLTISIKSGLIPSSISCILCLAATALVQRVSNKYLCCSRTSLTLLYIIWDVTFPFWNKTTGARYSFSLVIKFPLTPSKWRTSEILISSLEEERLSFVISVICLNLTPLLLRSSNALLYGSTSIDTDGALKSAQISTIFLARDKICSNVTTTFSWP